MLETRSLKAGARLAIYRSGGGGYGDPRERPAELVQQDVEDGYVSREKARDAYGLADGES